MTEVAAALGERDTAFQLLRYMVRIWERQRAINRRRHCARSSRRSSTTVQHAGRRQLPLANCFRQPGVDRFDIKRLRSQWGESRTVETYLVDVGIGAERFPLVEVVSDDRSDEVLLGRNPLNLLNLTLNGPKQVVEVRG